LEVFHFTNQFRNSSGWIWWNIKKHKAKVIECVSYKKHVAEVGVDAVTFVEI